MIPMWSECYPDFIAMQLWISLAEIKTDFFLFRDSSMVDPDLSGC